MWAGSKKALEEATWGSRHRAQIHPPKQQQQLRTMEIEQDDPATTTLQALPADNLQLSLSNILTVPLQFLGSRVKNKREAEVILEISRSANSVDCILRNYECTAAQTQALHEAWDTLWLSREPLLVTAIPLIGQRMSEVNQQRAMLINKLDIELCKLQVKENSLLQFVDMNLTINKELKAEGVERLAAEKMLLVEMEQELVARIRTVCAGASLKEYGYMSHFIAKLVEGAAPLVELNNKQMLRENNCRRVEVANCSTAEDKHDSALDPKEYHISKEPKISPENLEKYSNSSEIIGRKSIQLATSVHSQKVESRSTLMMSHFPIKPCIESTFLKTTLEIAARTLQETNALSTSGTKTIVDPQGVQHAEESLNCLGTSSDSVKRDANNEIMNPSSSDKWPNHAPMSEEHSSFTSGYHTTVEQMVLDSSSASEEQLPGQVTTGKFFAETQQQQLLWRHVVRDLSQPNPDPSFQVANEVRKSTSQLSSPCHPEAEEIGQPKSGHIVKIESTTCRPGSSKNTDDAVDGISNISTVCLPVDKVSESLGLNNLQHYWSKGFAEKLSVPAHTCNSLDDKYPGVVGTNGDGHAKCMDVDMPCRTSSTSQMKMSSFMSKEFCDIITEVDRYHGTQDHLGASGLKSHLKHLLQPESSKEQEPPVCGNAKASWDPAKRMKLAESDIVQVDNRQQLHAATSEHPSEVDKYESLHEVELCQGTRDSNRIDAQEVHDEETDGFNKLLGKSLSAKSQTSRRQLELLNYEAEKGQSYASHKPSIVDDCCTLPTRLGESLQEVQDSREEWLLCGTSCIQNKTCVTLETNLLNNCMQDQSYLKVMTQSEAFNKEPKACVPSSIKTSNGCNATLQKKLLNFLTEENRNKQNISICCPSTPNVSVQTSVISSDDPHLNFSFSMSGNSGNSCLQSDELHCSGSELFCLPNDVKTST